MRLWRLASEGAKLKMGGNLLEKPGFDLPGRDMNSQPCNSLEAARSIAADALLDKGSDWFAAYCKSRQRIWIKIGANSYTPHSSEHVTLFLQKAIFPDETLAA